MSENTRASVSEEVQVPEFAGNEQDFVQVRGQVRVPGEYLFKDKADVLYYLNKSGGPAFKEALGNFIIIRREDGQRRTHMYDLSKLRLLPEVKRGDILVFHGIVAQDRSKPAIIKRHAPLTLNAANGATPASTSGSTLVRQSPLESYVRTSRFKRLLNQMVAVQLEHNLKTLAILSAEPGEGKTFLAAALAFGHARLLSSRILVVDTVHQPRNRSLRLERLISRNGNCAEDEGCVDLLTTRSLEGGEQESNDFRIGRELRAWGEDYDLVLVDTCALNAAEDNKIDPIIVGSQVDGAILVTSKRTGEKQLIAKVSAMLRRSKVRLRGVVYNEP